MSPLVLGQLFAFGVAVGAYGTVVGAGGGFVVVPLLLLVFHTTPQQTIGTSLAVVFLNALSGTAAYVRAKRIDYRSGWKFALATLPGAVGGAYLSETFSARAFHLAFGALLCLLALFLVGRPERGRTPWPAKIKPGWVERTLVDATGERFTYRFNERGGVLVSVLVGVVSSNFGIGGGIIHVPLLVHVFGFPAHIATATSHFILAITAGLSCAFHMALGHTVLAFAAPIGAGAVLGAQVGGAIAHRVKGAWLLRLLALALLAVGARLMLGAGV